MPVFDLLERMMMKKLNFPPGVALRLVARSAYVGKIPNHNMCLILINHLINPSSTSFSFSIHIICWSHLPFLWRPSWFLRRIRFRPNFIYFVSHSLSHPLFCFSYLTSLQQETNHLEHDNFTASQYNVASYQETEEIQHQLVRQLGKQIR